MVIPDSSLFNPASHQRFEEYNKVQKYKKYLLKEKLLHDIITVYTELEYENTDMNDTGGKIMIISERIFCVMEQKNITQLELSRRTGIATSNISDWKKKKTNPKADCLLSICDALEITPEQLLTGKGIDPEYKDADMDYEVTRSDIKILKQIHSLGDAQYKRLMAYMKALQKLEQMENMVEE